QFECLDVMAELPSGLLEACVVVGAHSDKLRDIHQVLAQFLHSKKSWVQPWAGPFFAMLECSSRLMLHVWAQGTLAKEFLAHAFSFLQKRRDRAAETLSNGEAANRAEVSSATEDISVPKDLDLIALPELCFPGGLELASEQKQDSYHFLVFTDMFGNRTHGVVVQYYRAVLEGVFQNGHRGSSTKARFYAPFAVCIISKFPYYNALKDCLSW
uniref:DENN domain-containing protein 3-like n=1 Tax=Pundamilia nyererei TaxID=303518 RepID=A0A3B4FL57_9CICH